MVSETFKVTPWEVEGEVDYGKLIEEFGINVIDTKLLERIKKHTGGELHPYLERGIFFAHRDLDKLLDAYEKGEKFYIYTGRGPSQDMHLGHLLPFVFVKWLQDKFGCEVWIQISDDEKFLFKEKTIDQIKKQAEIDILNILAVGFDSEKTIIVSDFKHISVMYETACEIAKKLNFSNVKATFGFNNKTNIGAIFYPAVQMVLAVLPSKIYKKNILCLIPYGIDQDPYFRLQRDINEKMGFYKPVCLAGVFLPGLQGPTGKMSSSDSSSAIFLDDTPEEVANKIKKYAFSGGQPTIEEHRIKGGNPDIDTCFQYLKLFFEPDNAKLQEIYNNYKSGKMLTSELKIYTIKKINDFLEKFRQQREAIQPRVNEFLYSEEKINKNRKIYET
ncbi:MAG: tryptophan--tRNA ligase [Candidatus Huberarchaeum crystalense]|uniref:Tryptophan--tRNA ligase n=1 Tax=Huberarchaeum crystalense TaxID=2014257 RepID=A0A2G9LJV6_HUBC1|nr:MAG: tryptophan--tRNA ligase [archaeon CG2_30_31_98]PIN66732.1 MAG: tryptophan--tRNA ligase [Candidatus Huberarchaeum crystalense]PIV13766.1 MAG: tryptophan--tRNA ligase [Candidatus Huberarchaeum crystalense]PIV46496.1 MAG: tryptophan--tRNA ligase [Candidatus Huberarchaeum crystalense]PIV89798.1 MAG: tryptophan--tRNA ligase [Candidatus Huberarchaeum crystalense]